MQEDFISEDLTTLQYDAELPVNYFPEALLIWERDRDSLMLCASPGLAHYRLSEGMFSSARDFQKACYFWFGINCVFETQN